MPLFLKRLTMGVLLGCVFVAVGASPAAAHSHGQKSRQEAVIPSNMVVHDALCRSANHVRKQVIKKFGKRAPGRDICKYGISVGVKPTKAQEDDYLLTLQRMIAPPPVQQQYTASAPAVSYQASGSTGASSYSTGGSGSLPACASESGTNYSTGPTNTNAKSGATGRYQITPGTHSSLCSDLGWSPSAQDQCAARIYKVQGSGAWTVCGGGG